MITRADDVCAATRYKREELAVRFAFLFTSTALAGAFGGLLA
jgi:hypothetical protein